MSNSLPLSLKAETPIDTPAFGPSSLLHFNKACYYNKHLISEGQHQFSLDSNMRCQRETDNEKDSKSTTIYQFKMPNTNACPVTIKQFIVYDLKVAITKRLVSPFHFLPPLGYLNHQEENARSTF